MLKSIDSLVGLALVMLVASMAVTVLTQIWTLLLNSRGVQLRNGLAGLLRQIDPRFSVARAVEVIEHVLKHPSIAEGGRMGALVHREEFTRLLLELASGDGPRTLPEAGRAALAEALRANGIPNPAAALGRIRDLGLALELSHPALGAGARHDFAILQAASSSFVAKVNSCFDQTIDRVSARFTFSARRIAVVCSVAVALAVQLDTVALLNRFLSDDALRGALVQQAAAKGRLPAATVGDIDLLTGHGLLTVWSGYREWKDALKPGKLPGIALSVLLLSLGAPFWFEILKNLLRLRSAIAVKDDSQREERRQPENATFDFPFPDLLKGKADLQLGEAAQKCQ